MATSIDMFAYLAAFVSIILALASVISFRAFIGSWGLDSASNGASRRSLPR
jgi:hypothetical protein